MMIHSPELVLNHYSFPLYLNKGMGNTEGWVRGGGGTVSSIDNIPFPHIKKFNRVTLWICVLKTVLFSLDKIEIEM